MGGCEVLEEKLGGAVDCEGDIGSTGAWHVEEGSKCLLTRERTGR